MMDRMLMDVAASNFDDAQNLGGERQVQLMMLGMEQMARAASAGSRHGLLLRTAADNFAEAQDLTGQDRGDRLCLGLMQFARGLL